MNKLYLSLLFALLAGLSSPIAHAVTWLYIDQLQCYLQLICDIWYQFKYEIFHAVAAFLLYKVFVYAYVYYFIAFLQEKIESKLFGEFIQGIYDVLGLAGGTVTIILLMELIYRVTGLNYIFNLLYQYLT